MGKYNELDTTPEGGSVSGMETRFGRIFDRCLNIFIACATAYGVYLEWQSKHSAEPAAPAASHGGIMNLLPHSINFPLALIVTGILLTIINYVLHRRAVPTIGLNFRSSDVNTSGIGYPRKLLVYLSNDGDDIHLHQATWIKDQVGLQNGKPPRIMYTIKNNPSGQFEWSSESDDKVISAGRWTMMWIGLDSIVPEGELIKLSIQRRLGIVEIPATISGTAVKIRIPV